MMRTYKNCLAICLALLLCLPMLSSCDIAFGGLVGEMLETTTQSYTETETEKEPITPLFLITAERLYVNALASNNEDKNKMIRTAELRADGKYVSLVGADEDMYVSAIEPNSYAICGRYIAIKYRTTEDCNGELFLSSDSIWYGNGDDSIGVEYIPDGEWHLLIVDVSQVKAVKLVGKNYLLGFLRIDCFTDGTDRMMDIAYVASFSTKKDAQEYDAMQSLDDIPYDPTFPGV